MPSPNLSSTAPARLAQAAPQLGLRANWPQFSLLVLVNAFVGGMVGLERAVVPLLAERDFHLASKAVILSFIISFGVVKALANLFAGRMSDRLGRKGILIAGWLIGLPAPFLVMLAPSWGWVVFANVLLGINQGLCWSTTSGYLAAAYALRPQPFYLGVVFALAGLLLSMFFVRETHGHARHESSLRNSTMAPAADQPSFAQILLLTSWKDRALFAASQAGMVNNLNDGLAWGLFPLFFAAAGLTVPQIGLLAAIYPGVQGLGQLATGALSDRLGRKGLIVAGMWVQAVGIGLVVLTQGFLPWAGAMVLLGLGTALVYPTLLAAVSDVAHPAWRASAVGVYRLWRDGGYALGALLAGVLADLLGVSWAIAGIALLTFASGVVVLIRMYETLPAKRASTNQVVGAARSIQGTSVDTE